MDLLGLSWICFTGWLTLLSRLSRNPNRFLTEWKNCSTRFPCPWAGSTPGDDTAFRAGEHNGPPQDMPPLPQ